MTGAAEVRIGEMVKVEKKGTVVGVLARVPEYKCSDQGKETQKKKKKEDVANNNEEEKGETESN